MPATSIRFLSAAALALGLCAAPSKLCAEDYSAWTHAKAAYLNTGPDGANVTSTLRNFPVLLRLTAADFPFAEAKGKGQDFRVASRTGTHLKYQIDRWDSAKGIAEVWVKADSVRGNAYDSLILRWGNAAAADSSDGTAVFPASEGYLGVWHLGGSGTAQRPNAVAGGPAADPVYFDGDENAAGVIGAADSLDGDAPYGDNLQLGDGYADFSGGFTFSMWCKPASAAANARLLDMGNGPGADELVFARDGTGNGLILDNYAGNVKGTSVKAADAIHTGAWEFLAVTVSGTTAKIYRNGALAQSGDLGKAITNVRRAFIYLGRNDWDRGGYFKGPLDEAAIAKTARSADWMKLAYANQMPGQKLVSFKAPPVSCQAAFSAPADTALGEGSPLTLTADASCAQAYLWSVVSGAAPRLLEPDAKALQIWLPRIARDTSFTLRFTATYADSSHSQDVVVRIKADVPDPVFTLPDTVDWNGKDSLLIQPSISNLSAIEASRQPELHWAWNVDGGAPDTAWRDGGMLLEKADGEDGFAVRLCLDNGGPAACHEAWVRMQGPVALRPARPDATATSPRAFDAAGRRLPRASAIPVTRFTDPATRNRRR